MGQIKAPMMGQMPMPIDIMMILLEVVDGGLTKLSRGQ